MAYPKSTEIGSVNGIFAGVGRKSVPTGGYTLAAEVTGIVVEGTPLKRGATAKELTILAAGDDEVVAVAGATVDTAITRAIPAHEQGEFSASVCGALLPLDTTITNIYAKSAANGIFFRDVVSAV